MSSNLSPLLLPGDYPSLRILPHAPYALDECKLDIYEDIYSNTFVNQRHYNWIATDPTTMTHTVYSILATPESQTETEQIHRVLKTFAKGYHDFLLTVKAGSSKTLPSRLDEALREREKKDLYDVFDNSAFATKFAELEVKHSQKRTQFKMGIIYVKQNQLHPREWFTNGLGDDKLDQRFWEFMKIFGKEIDLLDWSGYLGDMGRKGQTYFDFWKESISSMNAILPFSLVLPSTFKFFQLFFTTPIPWKPSTDQPKPSLTIYHWVPPPSNPVLPHQLKLSFGIFQPSSLSPIQQNPSVSSYVSRVTYAGLGGAQKIDW
eukprot:TRINITY_DN3403_c0_g1_i3.p1 TRINITY_DN3403_c0_g1~~TRINITY_DN3403_c0_g1_i3.p1  ORF type:complete len:318 (-),score=75.36 TRINITY_DN3403_c0_g1_i3:960-1913(-)